MQEEEKDNGVEGISVEEMFLGVQEFYQEAQLRAQEEDRAFTRTELFRMGKFGTYRLHILFTAPNPDGSLTRPGYEYPVHQLLPELEKPITGDKPQKMYATIARVTDVGYNIDPIETCHRVAVEAAKEDGDDKLAEKITEGPFGGGLKYSYGHCFYVFDLGGRARGMQVMTLFHTQFKDLDERKFKLRSKKLVKNPSYLCPVSSVYGVYPVEIEKRKSGVKTEHVVSTGNESEPVPSTKEELTTLMGVPHIPGIIYRYTCYHLRAAVEFSKQCGDIRGMSFMEMDEMKIAIDTLDGELPKEDISTFSFDRRTKDNRESGREGGGISLDDLFECYDKLQQQELGEKTEEGQELRVMIRGYIEQEGLSVYVTCFTNDRGLLDPIESEMKGPKPSNEPEDVPGEEKKQPEETEERTGCPRHRR